MPDAGLFIGWGGIIPGRELQATKLLSSTLEFYGKLVDDGRIESFEPVLLESHGGGLEGFVFIRGTEEQIFDLRKDREFEDFIISAQLFVKDLGIIGAFIGEGLWRVMGKYEHDLAAVS